MADLLHSGSNETLVKCLNSAKESLQDPTVDKVSAKLTLVALLRFAGLREDKPSPVQTTKLKEAIVRTGAYYFGPMFVLNKGTSLPTPKILWEMENRGFYPEPLKHLNNAQLNLFFITLKCTGLVSDKYLSGYMKYEV